MVNKKLAAVLATCLLMSVSLSHAEEIHERKEVREHREAHVQRVKAFSLNAINERIRILELEKRCVSEASTVPGLRACSENAHENRESLKRDLKPQFDHLKKGL